MSAMLRSARMLFAAAAALCAAVVAAADSYTVPPDLWDRPRSAQIVLAQPAIQQAVRAYLDRAGSRIVIRHAAGQEPLLYAEELRSWLIALAVNGEDIVLRADRGRGEPLTLELMQ